MADHPLGNGGGLMRVYRAARCSLQGLTAAWKNESAFRQELALCIPLGIVAWLISNTAVELILLLGSLVLVLIVELLNSAIEAVVDRIGDEYHELAGRAKDMGSAAVFMSMGLVLFTFTLIAFDNLIAINH